MEITTRTNTSNAEMVTIPRAEYESMQAQLDWLMEQLRLMKKQVFGASFEKSHEDLIGQMNFLFDEAELHLEIERKEEAFATVAGYTRKKCSGGLDEILPEVQAGWYGNAHLKS